jgi:iron complex outermembrane receptor protein
MQHIYIKDRVVLTDQFARPAGANTWFYNNFTRYFLTAGTTAAIFCLSILDQKLDIVISHKIELNEAITLNSDLAGTFSQTRKVGDIRFSNFMDNGQLIDTFQINRCI